MFVQDTIMMFILILCAMSREAMVQTTAHDIHPARIFLTTTGKIIEDSDLHFKCSTHGRNDEHKPVYVYLCKNGDVVETIYSKNKDTVFPLKGVTTQQSGNYSCVFSENRVEPSDIKGKGDNSISVQLIDRILPVHILPAGSRTVKQGESVEFKCTLSDPHFPKEDMDNLVYSYLCKNGNIVQRHFFYVNSKEATFTVKSVIKNDTGNYSCVLDLQSKPLLNTVKNLYGNNEAFLQVDETSYLNKVWITWILILILSMSLGIWLLIRKQGALQSCIGRTSPNDDVSMPDQGNTSNVDEESREEFDYDSVEEYENEPYNDVGIDGTYHEIQERLPLTPPIPVSHSSQNVPLTSGGEVRRTEQ